MSRQASFSDVNWNAPASASTVPPIHQSWCSSQELELTAAWMLASKQKAASPNALHITRVAAEERGHRPARGAAPRSVAREYRRTSGRLDGSIIAAIITCQASSAISAADHERRAVAREERVVVRERGDAGHLGADRGGPGGRYPDQDRPGQARHSPR